MKSKYLFLPLCILVQFFYVNPAKFSTTSVHLQQNAEEVLQEKAKLGTNSCHTFYSEILKNLLTTYKKNLKQSDDDQLDRLATISNEEQQFREDTTELLEKIHASIKLCKAEEENLNFFDCVQNSGEANIRAVWKASQDSSEIAAYIRIQAQVVQFQAEKSSSLSERKYVRGTNKAMDDMMTCYADGGVIPSTTPAL